MIKPALPAATGLLLLFCPAARAEILSYPAGLQSKVTEGVIYRHPGPDPGLPPNPACTVDTGSQARAAYAAFARRLFKGNAADLLLAVSVKAASTSLGIDGWRANLRHSLVLKSGSGEAIDHFDFDIDAAITDSGPTAISEAFERGAAEGARRLERALNGSLPLARWLEQHGLAPELVFQPIVPRSAWAAYLDAGLMATSGGDDLGGAAAVRAGALYRFLFLQFAASRFTTSFSANPVFGSTEQELQQGTWDAGGEAGVLARLPHFTELRLGGGVHRLWGRLNFQYFDAQQRFGRQPLPVSFRFAVTSPTAFAALQYNGWRILKTRLRIGVEARGFFNSGIEYSELQRTVSAADYSVGGFLGIEFPSAGALQ